MTVAVELQAPAPLAPLTPEESISPAQPPIRGRRWSDGGAYVQADPNAPWSMAQQWPNLVAALSEQAVESSNLLLRALNYLGGAGRLRRAEAKALVDAMHQLRSTSLRAQQITRLASGRIRQAQERVELADVVRRVLDERSKDFEAAGAEVRAELESVDVLLDPPVAISLLQSVLDWALSFSKEGVFALRPPEWESPTQLEVRVTTPPRQAPAPNPARPGEWQARPRGRRLNDGLHWMLLRQIAASAGVEVRRTGKEGVAILTIQFPRSFLSTEGISCLDLTEAGGETLRDSWVLVIAGNEKMREESVACLRQIGIESGAVATVEDARELAAQRKPAVLVPAFDVPADQVAQLRQEVLGGEERCPLVEITRDVPSFHLNGFDRFETPKVGREQLTAELPPTVLFELVKVG